jgi:hypothetical protein
LCIRSPRVCNVLRSQRSSHIAFVTHLVAGSAMTWGIRKIISLALLACAVVGTTGLNSDNARTGLSNPQVASGLIEVHIRRLHLVRPDLIPYPIAYEVIC